MSSTQEEEKKKGNGKQSAMPVVKPLQLSTALDFGTIEDEIFSKAGEQLTEMYNRNERRKELGGNPEIESPESLDGVPISDRSSSRKDSSQREESAKRKMPADDSSESKGSRKRAKSSGSERSGVSGKGPGSAKQTTSSKVGASGRLGSQLSGKVAGEESEEEEGDPDDALPLEKRARKKMKDFGVQFPQWTEEMGIEYMTQDQLKRVLDKLRESEELSDAEIKFGEDLYIRRAAHRFDQFVKMNQVRDIVQNALHSIMDRMRHADEQAMKNRTQLTVHDSKLRSNQQQITQLKRIEKGQSQLIKMQKDQEIRLAEFNQALQDFKHQVKVDNDIRNTTEAEFKAQIKRLGEVQTAFDKRHDDLQQEVNKTRINVQNYVVENIAKLDERLRRLSETVALLPDDIDRKVLEVDEIKKRLSKETEDQILQVVKNLKIDNERLIGMDQRLKNSERSCMKLENMNRELTSLKSLEDRVFQANVFLERTLPMFVHHQLCEGLNVVAGKFLPELRDWEKRKTSEVYQHHNLCQGKEVQLRKLRCAVEKFTECMWKYNLGSAPFTFGENADYWTDMEPHQYASYDKRAYAETRQINIDQKVRQEEQRLQEKLEEHCGFLIMHETENLRKEMKTLIKQSSSKPSTGYGQRHGHGHGQGQPNAQNAFQRMVITNMSHQNRRESTKGPSPIRSKVQSSAALPVRVTFNEPTQSSQAEALPNSDGLLSPPQRGPTPKAVEMPQPRAPATAIDEDDEFDEVDLMTPGESRSSLTESRDVKVIRETKIINNVYSVRKVPTKMIRSLHKKQEAFMSEGRSEFNRQLNKWIDFVHENQEDIYETQNKITEIEAMIHLLHDQLEDIVASGGIQAGSGVASPPSAEGKSPLSPGARRKKLAPPASFYQNAAAEKKREEEEKKAVTEKHALRKRSSTLVFLAQKHQTGSLLARQQSIKSKEQERPTEGLMAIKESIEERVGEEALAETHAQAFFSMKELKENENTIKSVSSVEATLKTKGSETARKSSIQQPDSAKKPAKRVTIESPPNKEPAAEPTSPAKGESETKPAQSADEKEKLVKQALRKLGEATRRATMQRMQSTSFNLPATNMGPGVFSDEPESPMAKVGISRTFTKTDLQVTIPKRLEQSIPDSLRLNGAGGSSAMESKVSSLVQEEKDANEEFYQMAKGKGFTFAQAFVRKTFTRDELTEFVQRRFDESSHKYDLVYTFVQEKCEQMLRDRLLNESKNDEFKAHLEDRLKGYTAVTDSFIREKAFKLEQLLLERIETCEAKVHDFEHRLVESERSITLMADRLKYEYQDFTNSRKRWKSEFQIASEKAKQNITNIRAMLSSCERNNIVNTQAIKMILDSLMIEQLIQRQEVEDKKTILLLGHKPDRDLLKSDHGVLERESKLPFDPAKPRHDRASSQLQQSKTRRMTEMLAQDPAKSSLDVPQVLQQIKNFEDSVMSKEMNTGLKSDRKPTDPTTEEVTTSHKDGAVREIDLLGAADPLQVFRENATRVDPPVLKIERDCLSCADNKVNVLKATKIACLTHTASPIPYQGKTYDVSEILSIKAKVIAQTQRIIREHVFNTKASVGANIRDQDNEQGFIISPLLEAGESSKPLTLNDLFEKVDQAENRGGSFMMSHELSIGQNSPVNFNDSQRASIDSAVNIKGHGLSKFKSTLGADNASNHENAQFGGASKADSAIMSTRIEPRMENIFLSQANIQGFNLTGADIQIQKERQLVAKSSMTTRNRKQGHHARYSSQCRAEAPDISNEGRRGAPGQVRRSFFESSRKDESSLALRNERSRLTQPGLPNVHTQTQTSKKRKAIDFENMFENSAISSTRNSQLRNSSVLTGATNHALLPRCQLSTHQSRAGRSVHNNNPLGTDDRMRMTDSFRQGSQAPLKHKEQARSQLGHRPSTQQKETGTFKFKRNTSIEHNK